MTALPWFIWGRSESIYSIAARGHLLAGLDDPRVTAQWLFGFDTAWRQLHFERGITSFCASAGVAPHSIERVRNHRTLADFGRRIMSRKLADHHKQGQIGLDDRETAEDFDYSRLLPPDGLRWLKGCPACAEDDTSEVGWATWRNEHQLPGQAFCEQHEQPLYGYRVGFNPEWPCADLMRPVDQPIAHKQLCMDVSRMMGIMFNEPKATRGSILQIIEYLLRESGVLKPNRSKVASLTQWWAAAMPKHLPALYPWVRVDKVYDIFRAPRPHPLLLAAVLNALCTPSQLVSELRSRSLQSDIFGNWVAPGDLAVWRLPRKLIVELETGGNLALVASFAGISAESLRHWLRRNPTIKRLRLEARADALRQERRDIVCAGLARGLTRSDLIQTNSAAVRWLELHDRDWITAKWRGVWGESFRQRQRALF